MAARRELGGFSLVELLVAIGIVGLLMGLIVPAVQYAREASRRVQCKSRLHQMGIGVQSYVSANGRFPPGLSEWCWSVHARLLPYVDQIALYDAFDMSTAPAVGHNDELSSGKLAWMRPVDYHECHGDVERLATACLSAPAMSPWLRRVGEVWAWAGLGFSLYNHALPPNSPSCRATPPGGLEIIASAASFHGSGVHVVFADGRVDSLLENVDPLVWKAFATRSANDITR